MMEKVYVLECFNPDPDNYGWEMVKPSRAKELCMIDFLEILRTANECDYTMDGRWRIGVYALETSEEIWPKPVDEYNRLAACSICECAEHEASCVGCEHCPPEVEREQREHDAWVAVNRLADEQADGDEEAKR